jgi:hypothetical protein
MAGLGDPALLSAAFIRHPTVICASGELGLGISASGVTRLGNVALFPRLYSGVTGRLTPAACGTAEARH